jgi:hypothetical protein
MRLNKKEIISEIKFNNEAVLPVLAKKYFPSSRRILRMNGLKDKETPDFFSQVLAHVYMTIQQESVPLNIDFEDYFFTTLHEWIDKFKEERRLRKSLKFSDLTDDKKKIAADCVAILDAQSQQVIYSRVIEKLSYEEIAERFRFASAVAAQQEFNKAYNQLEGIVKVRLNISLN